jgi:hypothetical protein
MTMTIGELSDVANLAGLAEQPHASYARSMTFKSRSPSRHPPIECMGLFWRMGLFHSLSGKVGQDAPISALELLKNSNGWS